MTYAIERIFDEENAKALKKGIEQGIEQEKMKIIHNLLMLNMPIKQIAQVAEVSAEEIEKIREAGRKH